VFFSQSNGKTLLRHQYPTVAQILTHSVNLALGPKSGLKNKVRARTEFGLQNEARLIPDLNSRWLWKILNR